MPRLWWQIWIVLLALTARALLPVGLMPAWSPGAALPGLVICTTEGLKVLPAVPGPPSAPQSGHHDICPCVAVAAGSLPEPGADPVPRRQRPLAATATYRATGGAPFAQGYRPRAPPLA